MPIELEETTAHLTPGDLPSLETYVAFRNTIAKPTSEEAHIRHILLLRGEIAAEIGI